MKETSNEEEEVKNKVSRAIKFLIKNELFLMKNDVNERSVSHKFAEYLQNVFAEKEYDVDCEYNRVGNSMLTSENIKKLLNLPIDSVSTADTTAKTVYPDIIIHRRGTSDNLLVIEMKKASNSSSKDFDHDKLMAFTKPPYCYTMGLYVEYSEDGQIETTWFKNGHEIPTENTRAN